MEPQPARLENPERQQSLIGATNNEPPLLRSSRRPASVVSTLYRLGIVCTVVLGAHFMAAGTDASASYVAQTGVSIYDGPPNDNDRRHKENRHDDRTREEKAKSKAKKNENNDSNDNVAQVRNETNSQLNEYCAQAITIGFNLSTGETREFPTVCLPDGWVKTAPNRLTPIPTPTANPTSSPHVGPPPGTQPPVCPTALFPSTCSVTK